MPIDYRQYPPNWKELSLRLRTERSGGRCECTGECRLHTERCTAENKQPHPVTGSKVVLTVAHICVWVTFELEPCKPKCADETHLKAMCQRCHLTIDAPLHAAHAKETRINRKDAQRGLFTLSES
jgi:hypothetical protein